jgi:hypothetical protein
MNRMFEGGPTDKGTYTGRGTLQWNEVMGKNYAHARKYVSQGSLPCHKETKGGEDLSLQKRDVF